MKGRKGRGARVGETAGGSGSGGGNSIGSILISHSSSPTVAQVLKVSGNVVTFQVMFS